MYSPERDLAYIGPAMLREALRACEPKWQEDWFKDYVKHHHITDEQFIEGAKKLAQFANRIIDTPNPLVAAAEVGFTELPPPVQMAIYAKLGQICLAGIWAGVKDTHAPEDDPPAAIADLIAISRTLARYYRWPRYLRWAYRIWRKLVRLFLRWFS